MIFNKKESLKRTYFRFFLILIVIPIFSIIVCTFGIVRNIMVKDAISKVELAQENVSMTLINEVNDCMIKLSHFVYVNNSEIVKLARNLSTENEKEKYTYMQTITEKFQYTMPPSSNILSICFHMKNGEHFYLKDNLTIPEFEIRKSQHYRQALDSKGQIFIGYYNHSITYSSKRKNQFTIVASISPTEYMDSSENIEMISLIVSSKIGYLIDGYNSQESLGDMIILNNKNESILNFNNTKLPDSKYLNDNGMHKQNINGIHIAYKTSNIESANCKIINVINPHKLTEKFSTVAIIIFILTLVLFCLFYIFSIYFLKNIIEPINYIVDGFKNLEDGDLHTHIDAFGQSEIRNMIHSFNHMVRRLNKSLEENKLEHQQKYEAEMRALQSQINPHFLVNALNSIKFIAQVSKFDGIKNMSEALIKILSGSFRSNTSFYTINEEIEVLKSYVFLMEIRYTDGFEIVYNIDSNCMKYKTPRLILQPIVENSIVHGFNKIDDIGIIKISLYEENELIYFQIEDNGKGMTETEIQKALNSDDKQNKDNTSIGISNVNMRLKLNFGEEYGIQIKSEIDRYTQTTIKLPKII